MSVAGAAPGQHDRAVQQAVSGHQPHAPARDVTQTGHQLARPLQAKGWAPVAQANLPNSAGQPRAGRGEDSEAARQAGDASGGKARISAKSGSLKQGLCSHTDADGRVPAGAAEWAPPCRSTSRCQAPISTLFTPPQRIRSAPDPRCLMPSCTRSRPTGASSCGSRTSTTPPWTTRSPRSTTTCTCALSWRRLRR